MPRVDKAPGTSHRHHRALRIAFAGKQPDSRLEDAPTLHEQRSVFQQIPLLTRKYGILVMLSVCERVWTGFRVQVPEKVWM